MKWKLLSMVVAGLLLAADNPSKDDVKQEAKKLNGTWKVDSIVQDGQKMDAEEAHKWVVTMDGDKYVVKVDGQILEEGKIKIDPSKSPKHIDISPTTGNDAGSTRKGIYEVKGDEQKICFAPPDQERPKEFSSKEGSGRLLIV